MISLLPPDFRTALDTIVDELAMRPGVAGIVFFGSAARGETTRTSDLDLYAISQHESRGHLGRVIAGVPVEVSFGSLAQFGAQIRRELQTVIHAFATGHILVDRTGTGLTALCAEARLTWERGPLAMTANAALSHRFHLTDVARDLEGMGDGAGATLLGAECVGRALAAFCGVTRIWMPDTRRVIGAVEQHDPVFAARVSRCAEFGFPRTEAIAIADSALALLGGRLDAYDSIEDAG